MKWSEQPFDPMSRWKHGEKRGDCNDTRVFDRVIGRWQLGMTRRREGDRFGFPGSDGWTWSLTIVRNP